MKKFVYLLAFLFPVVCFSQYFSPSNVTVTGGVLIVASAPSGACTQGVANQQVVTTGIQFHSVVGLYDGADLLLLQHCRLGIRDYNIRLRKNMATKHPGFKSVQNKIQKEGYSKESAGAILANASRKSSPTAKAKNKNLKKVK
jgi:hypothetical protein